MKNNMKITCLHDSPIHFYFRFTIFFFNISNAQIFLKKRYAISLLYLDYFERNKFEGHRIGKGDKG